MFWLFTSKYKKGTNALRIFKYLSDNRDKFVSVVDLRNATAVIHHTEAIRQLRRKGISITNYIDVIKNKNWESKQYSYYMLTSIPVSIHDSCTAQQWIPSRVVRLNNKTLFVFKNYEI